MSEREKRKATPKAAEPIIDLHDDDFGMMLNCAVRYACGRQTYMPSAVTQFITPLLPFLSSKTLWCFDQDIAEARRFEKCGDPNIDLKTWVMFHEAVKKNASSEARSSTRAGGKIDVWTGVNFTLVHFYVPGSLFSSLVQKILPWFKKICPWFTDFSFYQFVSLLPV